MTRGAWISHVADRTQSSSASRKNFALYSLTSRQVAKSYVTYCPSSSVTTSASSLKSRQNARLTLMTCTAMNILFSTSTLASSGDGWWVSVMSARPFSGDAPGLPKERRVNGRVGSRCGHSNNRAARAARNLRKASQNLHSCTSVDVHARAVPVAELVGAFVANPIAAHVQLPNLTQVRGRRERLSPGVADLVLAQMQALQPG